MLRHTLENCLVSICFRENISLPSQEQEQTDGILVDPEGAWEFKWTCLHYAIFRALPCLVKKKTITRGTLGNGTIHTITEENSLWAQLSLSYRGKWLKSLDSQDYWKAKLRLELTAHISHIPSPLFHILYPSSLFRLYSSF